MFVAIPLDIKEFALVVSPTHWRVQAIILSTFSHKVLIINTYFPTDQRVNEFDTADLFSTLSAINSVLMENEYDSVIWGVDINADFLRDTVLTSNIIRFVEEKSFEKSWDKYPIDFTHVFEREKQTYTSTLDHFFWSEGISCNVFAADVLHLPNNTSDIKTMHPKKRVLTKQQQSNPSWKRATGDQRANFKTKLEHKLQMIDIPSNLMFCRDVHCKDGCHIHECDKFLVEVLDSIKLSAASCLPFPSISKIQTKKSSIFRWNEDVQPFKDNAMFWHSIWLSAGRPINTVLHQIMKKTRNVYHYQIRKNRRMDECIRKNTILDACINDKGDIFKEIRKLRKTAPTVSSMINGVTNNLETHFADVYEKLYNSIDDKENLMTVLHHLNTKINCESVTKVEQITPILVKEAISKLKNDKTDPLYHFNSDCIKNAPPILCELLAKLFKMYLIHGHISSVIMVSTVIPLIKDKLGDITSSNNYRSIALSSLVLKFFDRIILLLHGDKLGTDELQFGYQQKTSTNMCTWLAIETIDYFLRNGSEVFVGIMDMTKAFDNVKQSVLFWKLVDKGIPAIYLRLLLNIYTKQRANVRALFRIRFLSEMVLNREGFYHLISTAFTLTTCLQFCGERKLVAG